MKKLNKLIIVLILLIIHSNIYAQEWIDLLQNPNSSYNDIYISAENYYNANPDLKEVKGSGYKDFQRFKYYWKNRISLDDDMYEHTRKLDSVATLLQTNSAFRTSSIVQSDWKNLGPLNTPQATNSGSVGIGWVNTIFLDRYTKKVKYCGSITGGFWYFDENLDEWKPSNLNTFTFGVMDIEEDYDNQNIVYISLGTEINFRQLGVGIWKSTNSGLSFSKLNSPNLVQGELIKKIRISPLNHDVLYATSIFGIYKYNISTNTWATLYKNTTDPQYFDDIDFHPSDGNRVYFSGRKLMYTTNGGTTVIDFPYSFQSKYDSRLDYNQNNNTFDKEFNYVDSDGISFSGSKYNSLYLYSWKQTPKPILGINGTWQARNNSGNSIAMIKPRDSILNPKLISLIGLEFHGKDTSKYYNINFYTQIPTGTGLILKIKSTTKTNLSKTIYNSGILTSSFSGYVSTPDFKFDTTFGTNLDASIYIEIIPLVNYLTYNPSDSIVLDNITSSIKIAVSKDYINYIKTVIDKDNPSVLYSMIQYQHDINSVDKQNVIERFNPDSSKWFPVVDLYNLSSWALRTKIEFEQSKNFNNTFYAGHIIMNKISNVTGALREPVVTNLSQWLNISSPGFLHADVRDMKIIDDGADDQIVLGIDAGVFYSNIDSTSISDNIEWVGINNQLSIANYYGIGKSRESNTVIYAGAQDNGTNVYDNGLWKNINGGDGGDCYVNPKNPNSVYGGSNGEYQRSSNKGNTWSFISNCDPNKRLYSGYEAYRAISDTNFNVFFIGGVEIIGNNRYNGVYRTKNGCDFEIITPSTFDNKGLTTYPQSLSKSNNNVLVVTSREENIIGGVLSKQVKLYKTTNALAAANSVTWTDITDTLSNFINVYYGDGISNVAIHPRNENIIYVTLSGYSPKMKNHRIFKTTDGGSTWVNINDNLPDFPIMTIKVLDNDNEEIFVGTDVGLYYKSSTMNNWEPINNNLPMCIINDIEVDEQNGMMYVGTFGRGLWESVLPCSPSLGTLTITDANIIWNVDKRIYTDIEIDSGAMLTVKKDLLLSANGKITVHPGGKLVVDGGRISVGCGYLWGGVIVEGNKHHAQSAATHGWCEVKNEGTIERARIGIKSYAGGIVRVNTGKFINNRFSISFSQYSLVENGNHINLSKILNANFICNKPISDPYYTDDGVREGSKSYISIAQQDRIYIYNNTFETTYNPRADLKGTGIVTWASRVEIRNNTFIGLTYGIESAGFLNALQNNNIVNNEFTDVSLAITETAMAGSQLRDNTIALPAYESNAWLMENYGIKQDLSRGFNISNNLIRVPSTINNANTYGVLVRNSDTIPCNIEHNLFRKLEFANQLEGDNDVIEIQCNKYHESIQDWSINPILVGTIHSFGFSDQALVQAANFFPDNEGGNGIQNIRLNQNMTFTYHSVSVPSDSVIPLDVTENVTVIAVSGSNYEEECKYPFDPCGGNPIPCIVYAKDMVNNNAEASTDSIFKYKLNLAQQYRDSGMMTELKTMLLTETSPEWEEIKLPIFIEYGDSMGIDAQDYIDRLATSDYKYFMQLMLDFRNLGVPIDSIWDTELIEDIEVIAGRGSSISEAAKKILEMFYGNRYIREAERWEESSRVRNNNNGIIKSLANKEDADKKGTQKENKNLKLASNPDFLLIPNPNDGNFVIKLGSSASGLINIIDMHGKIIEAIYMEENSELRIEKGSFVPGVYTIQLLNGVESYQLNKRMIILE